ncbi:MAG: AMP-binding protein, partial [Gammaproteobacteria bacterium]|nr:AMP-binding protein [Gammaproteobacteria bacterium]
YGLTETSPVISVNVPEDNDPDSVGIPLRGVDVRIGENDELLVKTPGMMQGYWNNHVATREVIDTDGWLHTGDQARIENGHIYITGRLKDILVMSNGEKIPPMDMELALSLLPEVEQALVIGEGESFLSAILVLSPEEWPRLAKRFDLAEDDESGLDNQKLHAHLLKGIKGTLKDFPGYAKIRRVILTRDPWSVDNGLLTPTLKVKRAKVLDNFTARIAALYKNGSMGRA